MKEFLSLLDILVNLIICLFVMYLAFLKKDPTIKDVILICGLGYLKTDNVYDLVKSIKETVVKSS